MLAFLRPMTMLVHMSDSFGFDDTGLAAILANARDALDRGRSELTELETRRAALTERVADLESIVERLSSVSQDLSKLHDHRADATAAPADAERESAGQPSQATRVSELLAAQPYKTWRAQDVADEVVGEVRTKAQLDTVRTTIHRLVKRGDVVVVDRGLFRWGGA